MNRSLLLAGFLLRGLMAGLAIAIVGWFASGLLTHWWGEATGLINSVIAIAALFGLLLPLFWFWDGRPWPHTNHHPSGQWNIATDVPAAPGWFSVEQIQKTADERADQARQSAEIAILLGDDKLVRPRVAPSATPSA